MVSFWKSSMSISRKEMEAEITKMIEEFEGGRMTRRQLVTHLAALVTTLAGTRSASAAAEAEPTFQGMGLNHIALRVADVGRSRDFYKKHLGLRVASEQPGQNCFLTCGNQFVTLFRGTQAGLDHYCCAINDYNQKAATEKLRAAGIEPEVPRGTNRIYFPDPDGLKVQLAAIDHRP